MSDSLRKKSAPRALRRGDVGSPRALAPVAETWGAAPMPPPEPSSGRRRAAFAVVGAASLATVAALALTLTRTANTSSLDRSSDDWLSVVRRQVFPVTDLRTAGDIAPAVDTQPRSAPPHDGPPHDGTPHDGPPRGAENVAPTAPLTAPK